MLLLVLTVVLCFASKEIKQAEENGFGKAAYYDGEIFCGYYPISKANKCENAYKIKWKNPCYNQLTKTRDQLLEKKESNFEVNDLVRLENDFGLVIKVLENSHLKIQWLDDEKPIAIKPVDNLVLFQKNYAAPDLIKNKYTTTEQMSNINLAELKDYKWAAYHEFGEFVGCFEVKKIEFDPNLKMFRVHWRDSGTYDVLKSADELYKTRSTAENKYKRSCVGFTKKLGKLVPAVQFPHLPKIRTLLPDNQCASENKRKRIIGNKKDLNRRKELYSINLNDHNIDAKLLFDSRYQLVVGSQWHFNNYLSSNQIDEFNTKD